MIRGKEQKKTERGRHMKYFEWSAFAQQLKLLLISWPGSPFLFPLSLDSSLRG